MVGKEDNYFNLNLLFYEENPTTKAIKIKLMLEEIFPSRFSRLFAQVPDKLNFKTLYRNSLTIKKQPVDLKFNFGLIKEFFNNEFYETIQKVFVGSPISRDVLFSNIMKVIKENYNKKQTTDNYVEPIYWTILKAHMVINYLQELNIVEYNKAFNIMEAEDVKENKGRFDEKFSSFLQENKPFLDQNYKIGVFAVGVLVRFVLDMQRVNIGNTPFEKKLKGYNLNPETLKNIYTEALHKLQQYQKNFNIYSGLREYINQFFIVNSHNLSQISNNELSFYFVAGLEIGGKFKREKQKEEESETL